MGPVFKLPNIEEVVLNARAGISLAARSCLQLFARCLFSVCGKYTACFQIELPLRVEVYPRYVVSLDSNIAESEEAVEASMVILKEMAAFASK